MKLKALIISLGLFTTCYSATNVELTNMLTNKEYEKFTYSAKYSQLTNLVTKDIAPIVASYLVKSNFLNGVNLLCKQQYITYQDAINIGLELKNSNIIYVAMQSDNNDIILDTWEKILNNDALDKYYLGKHTAHSKFKNVDLNLVKRTADIILKDYKELYAFYVFNGIHDKSRTWSAEYKDWADNCIKNVTKYTLTLEGWHRLGSYSLNAITSKNMYYDEVWNLNNKENTQSSFIKNINFKRYLTLLNSCEYKTEALEKMVNTVKNSELAYKLADSLYRFDAKSPYINKLYPILNSNVIYGFDIALKLNDADKLIDMLLLAKEELTADRINNAIPIINSLDADYRSADIVKALRNINSRYTLRLYDDRETWEPILSKIRAIIDVRQN